MAKKIKMKDLLNEKFSRSTMTGIVSGDGFSNTDMSLSKMVKEKYGDVDEQQIDVEGLTTEINNFNQIGETIFGKSNIMQVAEKLSWIASQAKNHTLSETEEWFDKITVNRNMKELTGMSKQFSKIANEAKSLQERMGALYEDMGNILGRYYEIGGENKKEASIKEGDYEAFFQSAMKKFGISSPDELDDDKKKEFFNYVDANYKAKKETD